MNTRKATMPTSTNAARERILATARELFYAEGIRAVGIDTIIERSGVAKATLYHHFPSKEALIEAYLQDRDHAFWSWFDQAIDQEQEPAAQLLSFFAAVIAKVSTPGYRGCGFLNSAAEFPHTDHSGYHLPRATKQKMRLRLLQLCQQLPLTEPVPLADQLFLLAEGCFASAPMFDLPGPAVYAREAARSLIEASCQREAEMHSPTC